MHWIACCACICVGVHRITALTSDASASLSCVVACAIPYFFAISCVGVELPADDRDHFDAVDLLQPIEMLLPERAGTCHHDLHRPFSRIRWPTAVFDAGT